MSDSGSNPREIFFQALNYMKTGDLEACEERCLKLIAINPSDVNALRLLGQVEHAGGELDKAEKLFLECIRLTPDYAHAYMDLGKLLRQKGRLNEAIISLKKALSLDAKLKSINGLLSEIMTELGSYDEQKYFSEESSRSKKLNLQVKEAADLMVQGASQDAENLCRKVLNENPGHLRAKMLLANIAFESNRYDMAEKLFVAITRVVPEDSLWWIKYASTLSRQDRLEEAENIIVKALEIGDLNNQAKMILAGVYVKDNRFEEALVLCDEVLDSEPSNTEVRSQRATMLKTLGRQDEAIAEYRLCMEQTPTYGEAYWALSNLKTYRFKDTDVESMESILADNDVVGKDLVHFNYALGKAYEHRKNYAQAFRAYQTANTEQKSIEKWDADEFEKLVDRIIDVFSPESVAPLLNSGDPDKAPVFILGMPRSGSTLQEQILSSHSQVEGTRELPYMPWLARGINRNKYAFAKQQYPEGVLDIKPDDFRRIGELYLQQAKRNQVEKLDYFIDKLPNNFLYVGFILLVLPNAEIIDTRLDPMDNCFSCFKQVWAEGQNFSYHLEDLGRYYRDYVRLMSHWKKIFPERIHQLQYEEVVNDLDNSVRDLLTYCGLPWQDNCLRFYQTDRAINTPSSEQVRQPIYKTSVAYWQNFGELLDPLKRALGDLI